MEKSKSIPKLSEETIDLNMNLSIGSNITMFNNIESESNSGLQNQVSVVQSNISGIVVLLVQYFFLKKCNYKIEFTN